MRKLLAPFSAGFVTVLVGFTSSAAIVFQAAAAAGASPAQLSSWMWALGIGMGVTCIGLSLRYRAPVVTAWSTPGAALLVTALVGVPMSEAIGAFMFCSVLILLAGLTRGFERVMDRIPPGIAAAMLAGVLVRFGMEVFVAMGQRFGLVFAMFLAYLVARRLLPRYAIVLVLALGSAIAAAQGLLHFEALRLEFAVPVFTAPSFNLQTMLGIGIPLFIVTMGSQNVPGTAVLRAAGYTAVPISPVIGWTGAANLLLAPFGCFALNLAAITAAICMGREAHEDPAKRYLASLFAGFFYLLVGVFGATVGALFAAFPRELVLAIAGLALFGTIAGGLTTAMKDEGQREPALITFLVTASGVSLGGVGSAFWGVVAGTLALFILGWKRPARG
ncbi:benzoate/H(+) symporter BenE family transporter [Cognatazoarcus halotolerans]|uniref:benzoate/H(+) symporter BenE family transporter n=1 Tax=Cognatazoarcus halotolerans TaxID=2686016 RepID=UPI001358A21E|nr:benzoate/H(+) symporter BenE family transporter [Cognatazoarcus halotolerans]MCB1899985.1 benzoate/H(+) symporter BenE family transporter [Rhodocyclaceae bacterium]MCP5310650.1 benzoate/H(+) symporter BenE family transporter [Zoogloeaceae bacterium]